MEWISEGQKQSRDHGERLALKVNINKAKFLVMDGEPAVSLQKESTHGVCSKGVGANSIWC